MISQDEEFIVKKQRLLGPVYDFETRNVLALSKNKNTNWLTKMIAEESSLKIANQSVTPDEEG